MLCVFCERSGNESGDDPFLVHRFSLCDLIVGHHQYFKGYCVLVFREHIIDPTDLDPLTQRQFFEELMQASTWIQKTFNPFKMNYACYGNLVPHMHWHLFPRYLHEVDRLKPPFTFIDQFDHHRTDPDEASMIVDRIRSHFS